MAKLLPFLVVAALAAGCSQLGIHRDSQSSASGGATAAPAPSSEDARYMEDIAQANLAEIAAGNLAASKAQSPDVRAYGEQMVRDHTQLLNDGSKLAAAKGVRMPQKPDLQHEVVMKKLEALSGATFDQQYLQQMVKDHTQAIQLLQDASSQANDPALRTLAQQALPVVQHHYDMAQRIAGELVGMR